MNNEKKGESTLPVYDEEEALKKAKELLDAYLAAFEVLAK